MKEINFDEDYCAEVSILQEPKKILLCLSDDLEVVDDLPNLSSTFKSNILSIINNSNEWHAKAINKLRYELGNQETINLLGIHILSEPNDQPLIFGLQFRVSSDIEHGRGMKLRADTMEIIEYGLADVAFC